jgi:ferritin-like metal-binding protein YciE
MRGAFIKYKQLKMKNDQGTSLLINWEMKKLPMHQVFILGLKEMYGIEKRLIEVMPHMIDAATSEELRGALMAHLDQTRYQVSRLEEIFNLFEEPAVAKESKAIEGIMKEAEDRIEITGRGTMLRDAALIMALKRVEHYEIASYDSLLSFSKLMEHTGVSALLKDSLQEEEEAAGALADLAKLSINEQAMKE